MNARPSLWKIFYRKQGRLRRVNGEQPVEKVMADMFRAIEGGAAAAGD